MKSKLGKLIGKAAPIAASFIPGIGPLAAAGIGAAGGVLSGGGLKGALMGGATGALGGGLSKSIVGSLAPGLSSTASSGLSSALTGGAAGLSAGGGLKGALLGSALGGAGGYLSSGGSIPGLGSWGSSAQGPTMTGGSLGDGSGVLGKLREGISSITPSGISSASMYAPVASGAIDYFAQDKAADELEEQQKRALGLITPIMNEQFTPGDLSQTPGYQFQLEQGNQALDRSNAARGSYFSGQAAKEAMDYSQGLADKTYQNAYQNWLADRNQRMGAAGAAAGITQGIGETRATSTLNQGQSLAQSLAAMMGAGSNNVYNPRTGTYYDPSLNTGGVDIQELLRQLQQQGRSI